MRNEFYSLRVGFGQQHCRHFIILGHQRLYRYPLASKRLLSDKNLACEYSRFFSFLAARDVRREERLGLRNSILMTYINVYITNPVVRQSWGSKCNFVDNHVSPVENGKVLCYSANEQLQQNFQMLFLRLFCRTQIPHVYDDPVCL